MTDPYSHFEVHCPDCGVVLLRIANGVFLHLQSECQKSTKRYRTATQSIALQDVGKSLYRAVREMEEICDNTPKE